MALLTKYGTIWGQIPFTTGATFFVAPSSPYFVDGRSYDASDGNDGLSPERALLTVARAIVLVTASADDVVVLLPGDHTVATASLALSKARMTLWGLPGGVGNWIRPRTTITTTVTYDQIANVTAADIEIANIRIIPIIGSAGIDFSAAADNLYIHDCSVDLATAGVSVTTLGIDATGGANNVNIKHCFFECDASQGAAIDITACQHAMIDDCQFNARQSGGAWAAAITVGASTNACTIQDCTFTTTGTSVITASIDGTGQDVNGAVSILRCQFADNSSTPIDNFAAFGAQISLNYSLDPGAGAGGTLITAIT